MQDCEFPPVSQDGSLNPSTVLWDWGQKIVSGIQIFGKELAAKKYKQYMLDAGFLDVVEVPLIWPQNTWPKDKHLKELGRWNLANLLDGLEGYSMAVMTRAHGMSSKAVQLMMVEVRKDMRNKAIHAYWPSKSCPFPSLFEMLRTMEDCELTIW
jgi:hypothetical protein